MPWLDEREEINRAFGPEDYREHTRGLDVEAIVYMEVMVESTYSLLEAQWAEARAHEDPRLRGIIAAAPVEHGEHMRAYLKALLEIGPRLKGVRRVLEAKNNPAYCLRPGFIRGVHMLSELGLSFDISIRHDQLSSVVELARACPQTSITLDHAAKPDIAGRLLDPWRVQMRELASLDNVACKISGMVTEAAHERWTAEDLAPYVAHILDVLARIK